MTQIVGILFGPSWKTSLLGLAGGAALALTTYLQAHQGDGLAWYVAAAAVALAGRLFSDSGASPGKSIKDLLLGGAPGSTLLGALAPVAAAVVTYAQGQQGLGWYVLAAVIPSVLRFAKVPVVDVPKIAAPHGSASTFLLLAFATGIGLALAFVAFAPRIARAQEAQPAAAASRLEIPALHCFDQARVYCLRTGLSFAGSAWDFSQQQIVRSVSFSGLLELSLPKGFGVAGGAGWQTGTIQGATAQELVTHSLGGLLGPARGAIGSSQVILGSKASFSLVAGTLIRF